MKAAGSPLRVAWLGHRSTTSGDGIITYSRETTAGLRARGVDVVFFHHEPALADADSVVLDALTLSHRLVISRPGSRRRLVDLLREREIDVVHVSFSFSSLDFNLPKLCHQLGIPIVGTFHVPFGQRPTVWSFTTSAVYRLYAQALAGCDAVIIFSDAQRDILASLGVPRDVIRVLPNGVDVDKYAPGPSNQRARFDAARLFSYVGRLDPEKNVAELLEAFLAADPPTDHKLVIVGGGAERRRLERRFHDRRVVFTGTITDEQERIAILRASDAFFLPSEVEGLSLAMLEAMACGVATVATDVGSDGEALRGAGVVLDPRYLEPELRVAVRHLIEVPEACRLLGGLARERVLERYSLATNLDRLIELYRQLAPAPPAAVTPPGVRS
jgi:glycosyltransferase involved in cell wall biosynthesis